jgi:hypothetical protein
LGLASPEPKQVLAEIETLRNGWAEKLLEMLEAGVPEASRHVE